MKIYGYSIYGSNVFNLALFINQFFQVFKMQMDANVFFWGLFKPIFDF